MGDADRERWNGRHAARPPPIPEVVGAPSAFADLVEALPRVGRALDVACGVGSSAVWLARRGLEVTGVDVSEVATGRAGNLARREGVDGRCRFLVHDLDDGLPAGPPVELVLCHLFDAPWLDAQLVERVAPGGSLAVAVLSEVGGGPGRFRVAQGALLDRFGARGALEVLDHREADGVARLLARRR